MSNIREDISKVFTFVPNDRRSAAVIPPSDRSDGAVFSAMAPADDHQPVSSHTGIKSANQTPKQNVNK